MAYEDRAYGEKLLMHRLCTERMILRTVTVLPCTYRRCTMSRVYEPVDDTTREQIDQAAKENCISRAQL
jgi:hypothetical protein